MIMRLAVAFPSITSEPKLKELGLVGWAGFATIRFHT
jgi:hypothetical protein